MREGGSTGRQNLEERKHVLCLVIIVGGVCVGLFEVTRKLAIFLLGTNNVLLKTSEEGSLDQPEEDCRLVPGSLGTRTAHVENIIICVLINTRARSNVGLSLEIGRGIFTDVFDIARSFGLQLLQGLVACIVVSNASHMGRTRGHFTTAQEKRALNEIPGLELPVAQDDSAVEPGAKENSREEGDASTNTNHGTSNLTTLQVNSAAATLPDDKHCYLLEIWLGISRR